MKYFIIGFLCAFCFWQCNWENNEFEDTKEIITSYIALGDSIHLRNSEADIIILGNVLYCVYTRYESHGVDESPAVIAAKLSRDGGYTWEDQGIICEI